MQEFGVGGGEFLQCTYVALYILQCPRDFFLRALQLRNQCAVFLLREIERLAQGGDLRLKGVIHHPQGVAQLRDFLVCGGKAQLYALELAPPPTSHARQKEEEYAEEEQHQSKGLHSGHGAVYHALEHPRAWF